MTTPYVSNARLQLFLIPLFPQGGTTAYPRAQALGRQDAARGGSVDGVDCVLCALQLSKGKKKRAYDMLPISVWSAIYFRSSTKLSFITLARAALIIVSRATTFT